MVDMSARARALSLSKKKKKEKAPITLVTGARGTAGRDGKDGVTTVIHKTELPPDTFMTKDEWEERIKKLEARTSQGPSAPYVSIKHPVHYYAVTTATYNLHRDSLKAGITILGVNFAGDVEITIPVPKKEHILYINDESGNAGTNNITVTTV